MANDNVKQDVSGTKFINIGKVVIPASLVMLIITVVIIFFFGKDLKGCLGGGEPPPTIVISGDLYYQDNESIVTNCSKIRIKLEKTATKTDLSSDGSFKLEIEKKRLENIKNPIRFSIETLSGTVISTNDIDINFDKGEEGIKLHLTKPFKCEDTEKKKQMKI